MLLGSQALTNDPYFNNVSLLLSARDGVIKDYSKNNHSISVFGNTTISSSQAKWGNKSIYFDGNGDYLSIPNHTSLSFRSSNFTFEIWHYQISHSNAPQLLTNNLSWGANAWGVTPSHPAYPNKLGFYVYNFVPSAAFLVGTTNVSDGAWHHIAVTRNGNNFYLYLNGNLEASNSNSGAIDSDGSSHGIRSGTSPQNDNSVYGYSDYIRITKNIARPIQVPTQPFPNW